MLWGTVRNVSQYRPKARSFTYLETRDTGDGTAVECSGADRWRTGHLEQGEQ